MAGAEIDRRSNTPVAAKLNETSIPGIFTCGNACKVYDLVDWVTRDSVKAGRMAAEYLGENERRS
jgi:DNA-binding LacI/PurR family transcriptional regulator